MADFHGVIPPIITPYDAEGQINELALRELVEWYVKAGCHGLWVCGGTGEGVALSRDDRGRMVELVMQLVAGRMKVIFHVGAASTEDALDAARRSEAAGVDAICSVPPFFYGKSDREVVDYYRQLGDETDRPVFLYNLPDATGRPLDVPVVAAILENVPSVIGIKHSGTNMDLVVDLLRIRPELQVLIGRGELMLSGLVLGAKGSVCASLCLAPERFVRLYRAFQAGDLVEAMAAQRHATQVKELYLRFPVIGCTKRVNQEQIGISCGPPRGPLAAVTGAEETALLEMADRLGLLENRDEPAPEPAHVDGPRRTLPR